MNKVIAAAAELQAVCIRAQWQFCFIGGLALQRWGQPRETIDADLTLLTDFGDEESFATELLLHFEPRFSNALDFAITRRVLLLKAPNGIGLDIAFGAMPFEVSAVSRSSMGAYPGGIEIRTCSAEDLIVFKAFAGRQQDWADIEKIIMRQGRKLQWDYITEQLLPLAEMKEQPDLLDRLLSFRTKFE